MDGDDLPNTGSEHGEEPMLALLYTMLKPPPPRGASTRFLPMDPCQIDRPLDGSAGEGAGEGRAAAGRCGAQWPGRATVGGKETWEGHHHRTDGEEGLRRRRWEGDGGRAPPPSMGRRRWRDTARVRMTAGRAWVGGGGTGV